MPPVANDDAKLPPLGQGAQIFWRSIHFAISVSDKDKRRLAFADPTTTSNAYCCFTIGEPVAVSQIEKERRASSLAIGL